jgi:anti-sigma B factor antagonist
MLDDAPAELTVDVLSEDGTAVLVVRGELDAYSAPTLDTAVERILAQGVDRLVLDLGGVGFIDSSGLRSMIRARKQIGEDPTSLQIRNPQPSTVRLLDITGLTDHFPVT